MDQRQVVPAHPVDYPESDGMPMAETDEHADALRAAVETLREHLASDQVYVSGNNFVYFTEGEPRDVVSPDCYVVKGVPMRQRRTFKTWEEGGRRPCFVLEITSRGSRTEDLGRKMSIYRDDLQVPEYFLFDLSRDWIEAGLRGFRLERGVYQPIEPGPDGRLESRELGLELAAHERRLRFHLPGRAEPLLTPSERAARAEDRAERAEAELARVQAELERLRGRL
ncbi:MAG: Uma2 family endonuclease [Planctomycetes bacterium]|nr:Uma2 family endonuclease [Planctomycetota bacterium]